MLHKINEVIKDLLDEGYSRTDIADAIEVTPALISTWLQKDNDFCPRINVAKKIYLNYNVVVYPYSEEALNES
jgi:predicted transcriptional regulator